MEKEKKNQKAWQGFLAKRSREELSMIAMACSISGAGPAADGTVESLKYFKPSAFIAGLQKAKERNYFKPEGIQILEALQAEFESPKGRANNALFRIPNNAEGKAFLAGLRKWKPEGIRVRVWGRGPGRYEMLRGNHGGFARFEKTRSNAPEFAIYLQTPTGWISPASCMAGREIESLKWQARNAEGRAGEAEKALKQARKEAEALKGRLQEMEESREQFRTQLLILSNEKAEARREADDLREGLKGMIEEAEGQKARADRFELKAYQADSNIKALREALKPFIA